ncbi:MAG TPA: hypothetical protein C5S50_05105 [Methanosarcinaceae archaeon]|nr:hypothetical protein [Methanosarcinaceae archaeon]
MITKDELAGIIDALGAATMEEICLIVEELAEIRRTEDINSGYVGQLCESALGEHLIEIVSSEEVEDAGSDEPYYIPGPNAFPDIPVEFSEIIDILELSMRKVDMSKVAIRFSTRLKQRAKRLNEKIGSFSGESVSDADIMKLEKRYSDLLNLYYDFNFWLPGGISDIEDQILGVSEILEHLKLAQDI